ncbi:cysteine hydrolase [Deferribacter autotrophicus]|uniref:Cysteine hydrolase n=1 Tax=Deferribacter autotrophicus TaxID=500465 RepID=A0A5A8F218_9BACT|nr:isochorismatase family cysteine hydrolase [Deferribacter autotrophicus]KAA0258140.1 cysteine hydrolase [Deferribacter autotrophicus]
MKKALLVIDMLNDFILDGAPLQVPDAKNIIPNIKREIEKARKDGYPVIYVCDAHDEDDVEFKIWPKHCVKNTEGAKVVDELAPKKDDYIVEKTRYSGFFNTNLNDLLQDLGVDTLIVTGVVTNICVMYTVADAVSLGYKVIVPKDCITGLDEKTHEFGIYQLEKVHMVELI